MGDCYYLNGRLIFNQICDDLNPNVRSFPSLIVIDSQSDMVKTSHILSFLLVISTYDCNGY